MIELMMILIGWLIIHATVLKKINKDRGEIWTVLEYWKQRKWGIILSVLTTMAGVVLVIIYYQETISTAWGTNPEKEAEYLAALLAAPVIGTWASDKFSSVFAKKLQ